MERQWIFKPDCAPLCSLKAQDAGQPIRDSTLTQWTASLLNPSGISAVMLSVDHATLAQAMTDCEAELRLMGHEWGPKSGSKPSAPSAEKIPNA